MKKLSKLFLLALVMLFAFSLASCKKKKPNNDDPGNGGGGGVSTVDPYWDKDGNGLADWTEKPITLTFATWAYTDSETVTIDYLMAQAFTQKYPNVKVEMDIVGYDGEWKDKMLGKLENSALPDVFLVRRLEDFLPNNMLADLTDMYNHDADTEYILDSVKNLGVYNGKRYVIPTYIYPTFWVVNKTLLSKYGQSIPSYDWTWEQMTQLAQTCTNLTAGVYEYGMFGSAAFYYEYPKVVENRTNPENEWYACAYDGNKFQYMSDSFYTAMSDLETAWTEGWLKDSMSTEEVLEKYGINDENWDPRYQGKVALWREASWSLKEHLDEMKFDYDLYPAPSGVGMGNTDIAAVSALSQNKQAAYQLLKWMSYSEEGILKRFELYQTYKDQLYMSGNNYPYPVADYGYDKDGVNKIWSSIPYGTTAPGLVSPQFVESLRGAAIQANKEVIGWDAADEQFQAVLAQIVMGETTFADQREAVQNAADVALKLARQAVDALLK